MSDWQPIETAPHETVILTYGSRKPGVISIVPVVAQKRFKQTLGGGPMETQWVGFSDYAHVIYPPTHWMPLPEPPK